MAIFLILVFLVLGGCGGCPASDPVALKEQLTAALPPGKANSLRVLAYLDQHKIEHSQYFKNDINVRSITATVRSQEGSCSPQKGSLAVFIFDDHDVLATMQVRPEYTGP
jgi:hypothetical protein